MRSNLCDHRRVTPRRALNGARGNCGDRCTGYYIRVYRERSTDIVTVKADLDRPICLYQTFAAFRGGTTRWQTDGARGNSFARAEAVISRPAGRPDEQDVKRQCASVASPEIFYHRRSKRSRRVEDPLAFNYGN